ncbi:MAG: ATPase [Burkholderiales bacterium]|nr:ATPase [Burkholderiales bacterium]
MKHRRGGSRTPPLNQPPAKKDSYRAGAKVSSPSLCPQCGATFRNGRWTWQQAPENAPHALCPACHRINDEQPAGYVTLAGEHFRENREELIRIARHCEASEKANHPMQRIMAIEDSPEGLCITTTDPHLARRVAERIHEACKKNSLSLRYSQGQALLRAHLSC